MLYEVTLPASGFEPTRGPILLPDPSQLLSVLKTTTVNAPIIRKSHSKFADSPLSDQIRGLIHYPIFVPCHKLRTVNCYNHDGFQLGYYTCTCM